MADTTDTAPGPHPDAVKIDEDGTVDTGGRRGWVWMQDETGGRFDVRSDRVAWRVRRGATVVPDYPVHYGPSARPPKPATSKSGGPAAPTGLVGLISSGGPPPPDDDGGVPPDPVSASSLGAVGPADDRQPDITTGEIAGGRPADAETPSDDDGAGDPAADDDTTTKTRKGGRIR